MSYSITLVVGAAQLRCGTMHVIALSSEPVARVVRSLCRPARLYKPRSEGSTVGQSELAHDTGTKSDAVDLSSVAHVPHLI